MTAIKAGTECRVLRSTNLHATVCIGQVVRVVAQEGGLTRVPKDSYMVEFRGALYAPFRKCDLEVIK